MEKYKVLVIGDLHISDRFSGKHINYLENCFDCLDMIEKSIKEKGITHLICLGDWIGIGLAEKNLKERKNLLRLIQVLQRWNRMLNGNVYSLKGNHDIGKNMTDYDFFVSIGLLKHVDTLDLGSARIHMFDYGEENRPIEIAEDKYNIGCFHTNLTIEGLTTWYRGGVGTELSSLSNLEGITMAFAGHIHNPSMNLVSTSIGGTGVSLFYPGCPTRPRLEKNIWEKCFGVVIDIDDKYTNPDTIVYDLKPIEEVFNVDAPDEDEDVDETGVPEGFDFEKLNEVLSELSRYNMNTTRDYEQQIRSIAGVNTNARDIAIDYLQKAEAAFEK